MGKTWKLRCRRHLQLWALTLQWLDCTIMTMMLWMWIRTGFVCWNCLIGVDMSKGWSRKCFVNNFLGCNIFFHLDWTVTCSGKFLLYKKMYLTKYNFKLNYIQMFHIFLVRLFCSNCMALSQNAHEQSQASRETNFFKGVFSLLVAHLSC